MKKILILIEVILVSVSLLVAFNILSGYDWNVSDLLSILVSVFAAFITCVIAVAYLMMQRHRIKYGYISYGFDAIDIAARLKREIKGNYEISDFSDLVPGDNVQQCINKKIKKSSICFVIIGKRISSFQREEIRQIVKCSKRIVPILIDENVRCPRQIRGYVPLFLNDEDFDEKLKNLLE